MTFSSPPNSSLAPHGPRFTWVVGLVLAAGCVSPHELVPEQSQEPDASLPTEPPEGWLAEPFFQGAAGTPAQYSTLHDSIAGHSFWGVTVYDGQRTVSYEVDFHEDGSFVTRCVRALACEPFGAGTQGDGDQSWALVHMDAAGRGLGEMRTGFAAYDYVLPMRDVTYDAERQVLRFFLPSALVTQGALGAAMAQVTLTRGAYDGREPTASEVARGQLSKESP